MTQIDNCGPVLRGILILLLAVSCLFWLGDHWLPDGRPDEAVSKRGRIQARRS
jgi:hypothetical protein